MQNIQMVDLISQYQKIKIEVDEAVIKVMESARFINGPAVKSFENNLAKYLGVKHVVACANGTDALQIALMALGLNKGDEVIVPSFTYVATAEVIGLLKLKPIMVDVDVDTFNTTADLIEQAITPRTKAIIPVHLFGQSTDMMPVLEIARKYNLRIIEDNAQAIGADYTLPNGTVCKTGTLGDIGCTSFFPSKNLGCFGDGGAMFTNSDELAAKLRMIANHGQAKKYYHSKLGVNSRLDTIQAAILDIKLKHLDEYAQARQEVAAAYDDAFSGIKDLQIPSRQSNATHVFHQYTLQIKNGRRDKLKVFLQQKGIPSMVYYPVPLYKQEAFQTFHDGTELAMTEQLCKEVVSLPIHTEMDNVSLDFIIKQVITFFE